MDYSKSNTIKIWLYFYYLNKINIAFFISFLATSFFLFFLSFIFSLFAFFFFIFLTLNIFHLFSWMDNCKIYFLNFDFRNDFWVLLVNTCKIHKIVFKHFYSALILDVYVKQTKYNLKIFFKFNFKYIHTQSLLV